MKHMPIATPHLAFALVTAALIAVACNGTSSPTASTSVTTTPPETLASTPATTTTTTTDAVSCATADGVNDACACEADAHNCCGGFFSSDWKSYAQANGYTTASWKYGLVDCLGKHTVSSACKAGMDRRAALNAQMMTACSSYCRGTTPKPGEEPCVDHLKAIYSSLDSACRVALDAHEAAKPLNGNGPF